jgi:hypothetical protein
VELKVVQGGRFSSCSIAILRPTGLARNRFPLHWASLTTPEAFKRVIDTIRDAKTALGMDIELVIIDTFAKLIAAAAGDENSAKDQGAVFANAQRVKNNTGVHVAWIGHTGKDESRGARGSNALLGDVDVMVTIGGDEIKTATVTKANDAPEGVLFSWRVQLIATHSANFSAGV